MVQKKKRIPKKPGARLVNQPNGHRELFKKARRFNEFGNVKGKFLFLDVHKAPFRDERGKLIGTVGCGRDVTKEKQLEKDQKRILEELKKSESKYRILFETSTDAVLLQNAQGRILDCNRSAQEIFGYPKEEMLKLSGVDLIPKNRRKFLRQAIQILLKKGGTIAKAYCQRKNGLIFPAEFSARLARMEGERMLVAFIRDMTEHKRAEEALHQSERLLSNTFNSIQDGISILDKDLHIIRTNPAMERWFTHSMPLLGKKCYQAYHGRRQPCQNCPSLQTLKTGRPAYQMIPLMGPGEKIKGWLDLYSFPLKDELTGKLTGIIEYVRDITKRKLAEQRLREREETYSLVTKETGQLVYDYNIMTGEIGWGGAIREVTGYSPEEFVVDIKEWERRIHPDDRAFAIMLLDEAKKKGQKYLAEYRFQVKGGKFRDIKDTGIFLKDKRGKSFRMLGTLTDITEHKQADRVKHAVYKISEAVNASENLKELFRSIHHTIIELMPAKNLYIALYNSASETLSFPYWIDEFDETPVPHKLGRGLTEYVLRTGEPLLASPEKFDELVRNGEVDLIGAPSIDWVGVPLRTKDKTIGVLVVQTYTEGVRYREEDKDMLMFVSTQAAMAIERKRAEKALLDSLKEKEVLLKEIHHRVKNNMQVISSLLNLQSKYLQDPKAQEMFKDSQNRIRSMALVHEKLYQSKDLSRIDFAEYIQNFVGYLFRSYQVNAALIQLQMKLQASPMDINLAIPCGLIVNELVSNSLKHAFPEGWAGEIAVEFYQNGDHRYFLTIKDNGIGFPAEVDFERTETFGLQVVKTLVNQIDGTILLAREGGTKFTIEFSELVYKPRV